MKKGFRNYNYEFDKSERKMIAAFCKQVLKQVSGNNDYFRTEKAFSSLLDKINGPEDTVKLTKEEFINVSEHLKSNMRFYQEQIKKAWFFKRWMYKSMLTQYSAIYEKHFKE